MRADRRRGLEPPMRADVLSELESQYSEEDLESWLWPPWNTPGLWERATRTFKSGPSRDTGEWLLADNGIYEEFGLSDDVQGGVALGRALSNGAIAILGRYLIRIAPYGPENQVRLPAGVMTPPGLPRLTVAYRGAPRAYAEPLAPSAQREVESEAD
jgi:hypothetical protein